MNSFISSYIDDIKQSIDNLDKDIIEKVINKIFEAYKENKQIFIMGNGGSASTSSHFACDLGKGTIIEEKPRFRVMSLNDNMAIITAFSNDYGYDHVFAEQLKNLVNSEDIVIAISASGNSNNIIEGIKYAKEKGAYIIGFSGFKGGKLKDISNLCLHVENSNYGQVEDIHMFLSHMISQNVKYFIEKI
jgi:Phosphoheptose isomerase